MHCTSKDQFVSFVPLFRTASVSSAPTLVDCCSPCCFWLVGWLVGVGGVGVGVGVDRTVEVRNEERK